MKIFVLQYIIDNICKKYAGFAPNILYYNMFTLKQGLPRP